MIRILVADDSDVIRLGLRILTDGEPDMRVVGDAEDGYEAIERALEIRPDVIVMDLKMPRLDGISATKQIREVLPEVRVLALTFSADMESVRAAAEAGVHAYLVKDLPANRVVDSIRALYRGEPVPESRISV